jgi:hypothetical protein
LENNGGEGKGSMIIVVVVRQGILASSRHPAKGSEGLVSSRSTQLGKEDFYIVVIFPTYEDCSRDNDVSDYIPVVYWFIAKL